jgi:hypothetical protein
VLDTYPLPTGVTRRYPLYAQMPDGQQRRLAIAHLYFDGWNVKSIAGYLETTRTRVYETLHRFCAEEYAGRARQAARAEESAAVRYDSKTHGITRVADARLFETGHPSPQLFLWDVGDVEWHLFRRLDPYRPRRHITVIGVQEPLFPEDMPVLSGDL